MLNCLVKYLLPVVGSGVRKIVLSTSHVLNSRMLRSILKLCPSVHHLDISYTSIGDTSFKGLEEHGACSQLEHVDLSGCSMLTDVGLSRLAQCLLQPQGVLAIGCPASLRQDSPKRHCDRYNTGSSLFSNLSFNSLDAWDTPTGAVSQSASVVVHGRSRFCDNCPFRSRCSGVVNVLSELDLSDSDETSLNQSTKQNVTQEGLTSVGGLRHLNLSGCFNVTDSGLLFLANWDLLSHLEYLDVSGCFQLTGEGLRELMLGTPRLQPTNLFYCDYVDNGPFQDTANGCQNLQCFSRACCQSGE